MNSIYVYIIYAILIGIGFLALLNEKTIISFLGMVIIISTLVFVYINGEKIDNYREGSLNTAITTAQNLDNIGNNIKMLNEELESKNIDSYDYKIEKVNDKLYNIIIYSKEKHKVTKIYHANVDKNNNIKSVT